MKKKTLNIALIIVITLAFDLCLAPLRGISFILSGIISFYVLGIFTFFCLKRFRALNPHVILISIFIGWSVLNVPPRIIDFEGTMASLPEAIMRVTGIVCGYLFWRYKSDTGKILIIVCSVILSVFYGFTYRHWLHYLSFNTFTGQVYEAPKDTIEIKDREECIYKIGGDAEREKIFVLDFWSFSCGACFEGFPKLQKVYDKYKDDDRLKIFAVFIPYKPAEDKAVFEFIDEMGYTFPVAVYQSSNEFLKGYGVKAIPTILIINSKGDIVFRGSIDNLEKSIDNALYEYNL